MLENTQKYVEKVFNNRQFLLDMEASPDGVTKLVGKKSCNFNSLKVTASQLKKEGKGRWSVMLQGGKIIVIRFE